MFGDVVMGIDHKHFSKEMEKLKAARGITEDTDLTTDDLKELVAQYKKASGSGGSDGGGDGRCEERAVRHEEVSTAQR